MNEKPARFQKPDCFEVIYTIGKQVFELVLHDTPWCTETTQVFEQLN